MVIEVGSVVDGVVSRITNFGAFVDIEGGKNGLIHISEISDVYVRDVHDFLSEGDKVQTKVISIDERGKIALSLKQMKKQEQETAERESDISSRNRFSRNERSDQRFERGENKRPVRQLSASFEDKLSKFMKDSDERQADIKRKTDSKRGGRGSRRSD
ncbi:MAG: S1 RNA-binding domain-containing protein [Selenomonadaceae bacterium]|nr:S1 RNA-binding domain-containing protein [Selenomonadaceae bacterium]